ncbi:hypothetical protein OTC26_012315 [Streptomyces tirandamycinicus]|uniref:hypothetical protein n=1 Tax=Streptomyces tirandamycinicus TaxID=2174846 RepID=UPI002270F3EA|nr:hypothetical protein [Streptomyces tirandamycinicus]MCY0981225.1 hypothetical protein [Streptomyces tirandamycinicus]
MPKETPIPLRAAVALSGWAALAATLLPGGSPLRWVPVLLFVGFGPGLALLHPQPAGLRPAARLEAFALAAPISLSIGVLTATSLFLVGGFTVTAFLLPLAAFATVVAALPGLPLPAATRGAAGRAAHEFAPRTAPATGPATGPAGAGDGASAPGPDGVSAPGPEGASAPGADGVSAPGADGVSAPGAAPDGPAGSGGR